ncbi:MAG TPA: hypothetical protein VFI29_21295 [Hanamia sp.]|nr:hypothetical protein [Hanamia sp.]
MKKDTLMASGQVTAKSVKQIRPILGTNSSIKAGDVVYPLTVPSSSKSGLN